VFWGPYAFGRGGLLGHPPLPPGGPVRAHVWAPLIAPSVGNWRTSPLVRMSDNTSYPTSLLLVGGGYPSGACSW